MELRTCPNRLATADFACQKKMDLKTEMQACKVSRLHQATKRGIGGGGGGVFREGWVFRLLNSCFTLDMKYLPPQSEVSIEESLFNHQRQWPSGSHPVQFEVVGGLLFSASFCACCNQYLP